MYNSLSIYIIILLYSNNKILFINCKFKILYIDSSKMSIFGSSNNYTFFE